jgi:hypothetical protein
MTLQWERQTLIEGGVPAARTRLPVVPSVGENIRSRNVLWHLSTRFEAYFFEDLAAAVAVN